MSEMATMDDLVARITVCNARYGYAPLPGASATETRALRERVECKFGLCVPDRYTELLSVVNGLEWCGTLFFGTHTQRYAGHEDRISPGLIEETAGRWGWLHRLVVGANEDQCFCYDQQAGEYQVYRVSDMKPYRRFKTFDELFAYAFESRI